jgi:hypothetical protein
MNRNKRAPGLFERLLTLAFGAALLPGIAGAQGIKYVSDGAVHNSRGGWDLPKQGSCPADATAKTRPDCVARRFDAANSAACTALGQAGWYSWSTGVCTDLVNTTQAACEAAVDRHWNANGSCAIVMADDDRNAITCAKHGGKWVTSGTCTAAWVMPSRSDPAYGPGGVLVNDSSSGSAGTGDQCLRCHNTATQYNSPRVRDTEDVLYQGHKNMSRPVDPNFKPWGGPPFSCTGHPSLTTEEDCVQGGGTWDPTIYPADDSGNFFKWSSNQITVSGASYDLKWIYGDWLAALPRAIYTGPTLNNMSYSCGRCHTTGWTSDPGTTPKSTKHPEIDFPGITWTGTGTTGQVKTAGGVAGDKNVMSSWDQWGITCSRCHASAVDPATSAPSFSAPAGMSGHHNVLTSPDNNSGVCTDTRWSSAPSGSTLEALCTSNGGSFLTACSVNPTPGVCTVAANTQAKCTAVAGATWVATPSGWCSNAFYFDSTSCTANGYTWTAGWCRTADEKAACTGGTGDGAKTWRLNGTQASCQVGGATWSFSRCSVEGFCDKGSCSKAGFANLVDCEAAGGLWNTVRTKSVCDDLGGTFVYATDVIGCEDAGGRWIGNKKNRGQIITALCMECHRQETSGLPNTNGACSDGTSKTQGACVGAGATWTDAGNGLPLTVGPYHSTVAFPSHPHSNQFLNSPHARFTGKWSEIATGRYADRKYGSGWMTMGEAVGTGNGCTGCHEVHTSIVAGEKPFRAECTECHGDNSFGILHPKGAGTPFEGVEHEPMKPCLTCHMPGGLHLFRINADKDYSTFPMPQAMAANTAASTAPDGDFANAVWVDLDAACGQCHGGGAARATTTGSIAAGSPTLTVASAAGIAVGQRIRVTGAGAFYYDDIGQSGKNTDFDTYVKAVDGNTVTLAGNATRGVTNAVVAQNPTQKDTTYYSKADLAVLAKGIHNDVPQASFTAKQGANELTVAVDASASKCSGSFSSCEVVDWNWGDGTEHGTGKTATHLYMSPGNYTITLTVKERATGFGTATQTFAAKAIPNAPVVTGSCGQPTYPAREVECTVTVPANAQTLTVDWGDHSLPDSVSSPAAGARTFKHAYPWADNYVIFATVVDTAGLRTQAVIGSVARGAFTPAPFIKGIVRDESGQPVAFVRVDVLSNGAVIASTRSGADGSYSTGELPPGTYTLAVSKDGVAKTYGPFDVRTPLEQDLVAKP